MAFSACVTLANSQGQVLQAKVDLSQCPHGDPCAFHWELVFSRHLSVIQLKSPHHEKKKTLKARIWDLPVTRGLWCISTSAAPSHAVVSLFFCKHVLCTTLQNQIPHLSPVFKKQLWCHSAEISLYQYSTGQQPKDFCAAGRICYKKLFSRLIIQLFLLKVRLCYILIKDPLL